MLIFLVEMYEDKPFISEIDLELCSRCSTILNFYKAFYADKLPWE